MTTTSNDSAMYPRLASQRIVHQNVTTSLRAGREPHLPTAAAERASEIVHGQYSELPSEQRQSYRPAQWRAYKSRSILAGSSSASFMATSDNTASRPSIMR